MHRIGHADHISHHVVGVCGLKIAQHGDADQVVQDIVCKPGHETIGRFHTQDISVRVVGIAFNSSSLKSSNIAKILHTISSKSSYVPNIGFFIR